MLRVTLAALALALVVPIAPLGVPTAGAHHHREFPIQPGAPIGVGPAGDCTLNFVFTDEANLYIGTAGHCVDGLGDRIPVPIVGTIGTVVFYSNIYEHAWTTTDPASLAILEPRARHQDFALILIDEDKLHLVDPSVRFWGGPTGAVDIAAPGTPTLRYGQGSGIRDYEPLRSRVGQLVWQYGDVSASNSNGLRGWFLDNTAISGGDSGGPVLTADGRALGINSYLAATWGEPGVHAGPGIGIILDDLHAAGFGVELVTRPLSTQGLPGLVEHCIERPMGRRGSESCYETDNGLGLPRNAMPGFHDLAVLGSTEPREPPASHGGTLTARTQFGPAGGAAFGTPFGVIGASAWAGGFHGRVTAPADLVGFTLTYDDDLVEGDAFLAACVGIGQLDPDRCMERIDDDVVFRGLGVVHVTMDIPSGTLLEPRAYALYADTEGNAFQATTGYFHYTFYLAPEGSP